MTEYGKSLGDIVSMLDPGSSSKATKGYARPTQSQRRTRAIKVYKNPHTGEVVETKGGNHKVLKAWKAQYGNETVESWLS